MNLKQLHSYLGRLLDAGLSPDLTITALTDGWPNEVTDVRMLEGGFAADPHPKLAVRQSQGAMLLLMTVREDEGDLVSGKEHVNPTHVNIELPVEQPHKMYGRVSDVS